MTLTLKHAQYSYTKLTLLLSLVFISTHSFAHAQYFCFEAKNSHLLLLDPHDSAKTQLMYFPDLKPIQLRHKNTQAIEIAEGRPFEFHDLFDEIIKGKVTGQYEIVHQGALFYGVSYTQQKTQKVTEFTRIYNIDDPDLKRLKAHHIECL